MTKKHYKILARLIGEHSNKAYGYIFRDSFIKSLSYELKKDNRLFNPETFKDAIEQHKKGGGL